ncbi:chromosome segregation protein SMC [Arthrobacter sp. SW1]|uniref:AAA family ATPase n=1 Tax=Arthrobacter sp. SW1 TaxID=1920889 RepID=UPI000877CE0B|nr:SMC family ATPase [Arthrobacter sp. SW1]OFI39719.1 chromosome segregation protein SMC [Arthrobacter sp. SW1]
MRIHRLEIEAFGPFAGPQLIDFDQLSGQGLFLLNGATGAGKTSVLDAVCFALYGSVPGARQEGKRLRSDHAAPGAEPRVTCEFSARGRRFEVTRSPAWDRPSARGRKGFTTQQAKTLLRELVDGTWEEKSSRNDEAGAEIAELLGMDREQFTRVVMLPQGDFAAFLRSKAGDRLALLQKLFGTARFEALEQQLARQAQDARAVVETEENGLALLLQRAEAEFAELGTGAAGDTADNGTADAPLAGAGEAGTAAGMFTCMENAARTELAARRRAADAAEGHRLQLADRLQSEQERSQRHAKLQAAARRRDALAAQAGTIQEARERLGRHMKATVLRGHLDGLSRAEAVHAAAAEDLDAARYRVTEAGFEPGDPASALGRAQEELAVLQARLPDEERLQGIASRLAASAIAKERRAAAVERRTAELDSLRKDAERLGSELGPLEEKAAKLEAREQEVAAAETLADIVERHGLAVQEASSAAERHSAAREEALGLQQRWLDLRELRLRNAAAELAAQLENGEACPVCGSPEHPRPAEAALSGLAMADEEKAAQQRYDAADEAVRKLAAELAAAQQAVAVLAAQGGDSDPAEVGLKLENAREALEVARAAAKELVGIRTWLDRLARAIAEAEQDLAGHAAEAAQAEATEALLLEQHAELEALLAGLRGGFDTLDARISAVVTERTLLQGLVSAGQQVERAEESLVEARDALERALPDSGFASAGEARNQLLDAAAAARIEEQLRAADEESARVAELFESEDLVLAAKEARVGELPLGAVELADLEQQARHGAESARSLDLAARLAERTLDSIVSLHSAYRDAAAAIREPRERARMLTALAETARGAGDNSYKMSLNSYVLAARLEQVADAASERLVAMSDGRYTLRHSDARAARGQKSGLGLEVVDGWTGQHRDTATLSGGESFMASLSLALGLADVVQQEAGGVDIETLFVDEGFGSLDEQALEQVMDALEGLRDGGRVVGLVSHVAEMKLRIASQLQVEKGRNGSTVRIVEADIR